MRRGKPQQEIYRPGSGPLRKSNTATEESEPDTNLILTKSKTYAHDETRYKSEPLTEPNPQRKTRKPEQMIYVPRPVANAREMSQDNDRHSATNGNYDDRYTSRSKRYSNRRRNDSGNSDFHDEWRQRQGSEPKGMPNGGSSQRMRELRDTRSVEPSGPLPSRNYDKGTEFVDFYHGPTFIL